MNDNKKHPQTNGKHDAQCSCAECRNKHKNGKNQHGKEACNHKGHEKKPGCCG